MTLSHVLVLNYSVSWAQLVCAALLVRLGTSGITALFHQVLEDTMGASEVIKTHTLLHTFTGLLMGLGMVMIMCKLLLCSTKPVLSPA
jgi:uncharacterized iron-regulated membrane protein